MSSVDFVGVAAVSAAVILGVAVSALVIVGFFSTEGFVPSTLVGVVAYKLNTNSTYVQKSSCLQVTQRSTGVPGHSEPKLTNPPGEG